MWNVALRERVRTKKGKKRGLTYFQNGNINRRNHEILVTVQTMREGIQTVEHAQHSPSNSLRHETLPLSILRQEVSSKIGHEEAHVYSHR